MAALCGAGGRPEATDACLPVQVAIPEEHIGFQVGEAMQVVLAGVGRERP